jgi:hypothetical protein
VMNAKNKEGAVVDSADAATNHAIHDGNLTCLIARSTVDAVSGIGDFSTLN